MNKNGYKRSRFIINPRFQYRLIGIFVGFSLIMSVTIVGFLSVTYSDFRTKLNEMGTQLSLYTDMVNTFIEEDHVVFWVPNEVQKSILFKLILLIFILSLLIVALGFYVSHRIAGPLYRLNFCLLSLSENKPVPHLRFRNKDEFQNLAESFNKGVGTLTSKINELQKANMCLLEKLEKLAEADQVTRQNVLNIVSEFRRTN